MKYFSLGLPIDNNGFSDCIKVVASCVVWWFLWDIGKRDPEENINKKAVNSNKQKVDESDVAEESCDDEPQAVNVCRFLFFGILVLFTYLINLAGSLLQRNLCFLFISIVDLFLIFVFLDVHPQPQDTRSKTLIMANLSS